MLRIRELGDSIQRRAVIGTRVLKDRFGRSAGPVGPVEADVYNRISVRTMDEIHKGPPFKSGGPFLSVRRTYAASPGAAASVTGTPLQWPVAEILAAGYPFNRADEWRVTYSGSFVIYTRPDVEADIAHHAGLVRTRDAQGIDPDDFKDLGPRAYNRLRPKVEKANLFQTIAEAKDVPRTLFQTAGFYKDLQETVGAGLRDLKPGYFEAKLGELAKRSPSDFLAYQFGWKPFVKDVVDMLDLVLSFPQYVAEAKAKNGKWVRKRWHEDLVDPVPPGYVHYDSGTLQFNPCAPSLQVGEPDNMLVPWTSRLRVYLEHQTRVWYVGKFKAYYPEFDEGLEAGYPAVFKAAQFIKLSGLSPSPYKLWQITPWSFLADWFTGVGQNIQVLEDLAGDAVVSEYMYAMRYSLHRFRYVGQFQTTDGQSHTVTGFSGLEVKRRVPAGSPFGFQVAPGGLRASQKAVVAALALQDAVPGRKRI